MSPQAYHGRAFVNRTTPVVPPGELQSYISKHPLPQSVTMTMESMSAAFAGAFKSKQLFYKTIDETDAHRDWLFKNLWSNPVNTGLANIGLFLPASQKDFKKDFEHITTKSLMAVFICLPPAEKAADEGAEAEAGKSDDKSKGDEDGTIIGMIVLAKYAMDAFKRRTTIGIQLADKYQNKGYGREAINWALDWAFTYGDMHRVDIGSASFNERGLALYESIGFKPEGRKREVFYSNRQWHDIVELGMLVHEWEELRGLNNSKTGLPARTK